VQDAIALAACQPDVGAYFNFLLADEPILSGWQSGALYPDLTLKSSSAAFQQAIETATTGSVFCSALKGGPPSPDFMPPTVPGGLTATTTTSPLAVALSWSPSTDDLSAVSYRIYRNGSQVGTSTTNSWTDSGVAQTTSYSYTVRAIDSASNLGDASSSTQVATPDVTAPSVPSGLSATASAGGVSLGWQPASDNVAVTGYEISRDHAVLGVTGATTYSDLAAPSVGTLTYAIVALDAAGNRSAPASVSLTLAASPPPPPPPPPSPPPTSSGGGASEGVPDLVTTATATPTTVEPGSRVDVTATIRNIGNATSLRPRLLIQLPATMTLLGTPAFGQGSACSGTTTIDCSLSPLPGGAEIAGSFTLIAGSSGKGAVVLTASAERDSDPADNQSTIGVDVTSPSATVVATASKPHIIVGTGHADVLRGSAENDVIRALGGNDTIFGLGGNDVLIGGTGHDDIHGGSGNDVIYARDGERDKIDCGSGRDVAYIDRFDVAAPNCERVYRR
jgi:Ca2+-binding RTX toxin-like protein